MEEIRSRFSEGSAEYDERIRKIIPRYDEMLEALISGVRPVEGRRPRVIDIGCGTGAASALLLQAFPDAELTCLDMTERMLDLARQRLKDRGDVFRKGVEIATLDPFHGYKNAIDDQLEDAVAVLDAFHVVKLATAAVDEVRRRVQQDIHGHRGRRNDPLYRIRNVLRAGKEHLTDRQKTRLEAAFTVDDRHVEVEVAWHCAQHLRSVYHQSSPADGRKVAEKILASFPTCPIPEIARLGRTLNRWRDAFLGYFTTGGASNGGTEAINGLIELARRVARGFRNPDNYRLRMLLIGGGLRL